VSFRKGRRVVAEEIIAAIERGKQPAGYDGIGSCYIEFGAGRVGRVQVQFLSGQPPTGTYYSASTALAAEKKEFGANRRARWFGM
jgi:sulfide:quinone oxidoreductase